MAIPELEKQLLQLSPNDKLYIIQLLAQSLTTQNTHPDQPTKSTLTGLALPTLHRGLQGIFIQNFSTKVLSSFFTTTTSSKLSFLLLKQH